jgi:quercetin dioxygenase-like cupin family protein
MTAAVHDLSTPETGQPSAIWSLGCLFILKTETDDFELIDSYVPAGYSPPMHRHDFGTESFFVIDGEVRFVVGDSETVAGPNDFVHVPRSAPHSFQVLGDRPAHVLDIVRPAKLWDFFCECGEPAPELRIPDEIVIPKTLPEIVSRYDGQVLGPPINR